MITLRGKHEINSNTLVIFIEAYKVIAEVYGLNVDIQISVPEEGGWKAVLLLAASMVGINPLVAFLTGETADDWAKKGHQYVFTKLNEFIIQPASDVSGDLPKECIKQKNKMYEQFLKDDCVDTFHLGSYPPIPRNNFNLYIKELPDEEYVYLGETNITVHSPDWKGLRSWRGKIDVVEDTASAFDFDKELTGSFWEKVKLDKLPLHTTDVMKVQLVQRPTNKVKYLVIRVLRYNEDEIDSPISDADIRKFAYFNIPSSSDQKLQQGKLFQ